MESIIQFILSHANYAPIIIFSLLLLAGFNLPISEDALNFVAATLSQQNPENMYLLYGSLFLGAFFSDLICFFIGWFLGPKIFELKFFSDGKLKSKIKKMHNFYEKYGVFVLIPGRFIPFGTRNALFLSAGISKMNMVKFAITDFIATLISTSIYFYLYYQFGSKIIDSVKKSNTIIFGIFLTIIISVIVYKYFLKKKKAR